MSRAESEILLQKEGGKGLSHQLPRDLISHLHHLPSQSSGESNRTLEEGERQAAVSRIWRLGRRKTSGGACQR